MAECYCFRIFFSPAFPMVGTKDRAAISLLWIPEQKALAAVIKHSAFSSIHVNRMSSLCVKMPALFYQLDCQSLLFLSFFI